MAYPLGVRLRNVVQNEPGALEDWIRWVSTAGFNAVDVAELNPDVKRLVDSAGLTVGSFDVEGVRALFSKDEAKRRDSIASVKEQMRTAAAAGGKVCFMCLVPEDASMQRKDSFALFKEVFPEITGEAEKLGLKIVLEGYPGPAPFYPTLGCTPETLRAMFEAVPSKALCVNYDPSHLIRLGVDYMRFLREFADRVGHVHAKDCKILEEDVYLYGRHQKAAFAQPVKYSEGPWRYTIPGEGDADWAAIAFELDKAGYEGAVCVELEDHRYAATIDDKRRGLSNTLAFLQRYFR
jgi:sugar phosphate isomerase/epimerase